MSRSFSGSEALPAARRAVRHAQSALELRQALAVVLPLDAGLSLQQTARVLGMSPGWVCQIRRRFIAATAAGGAGGVAPRGGRRRQLMTRKEEAEVIAAHRAALDGAASPDLKRLQAVLQQRLGRPVARSTVHALWRRHVP
jgi:hypothetical protein